MWALHENSKIYLYISLFDYLEYSKLLVLRLKDQEGYL